MNVTCAICRRPIHGNAKEAFCRGCRTHICLDCDKRIVPTNHEPREHVESPERDEPDFDFVLD